MQGGLFSLVEQEKIMKKKGKVYLSAAVLTLAIYSAISSEAVSEDSAAVKEETDQNAVLIFVRLLI